MKKTKIDWCDSTWNPVTGCLHDCEYCYARRIAERFGDTKSRSGVNHELELPKRYLEDNKIRVYPFGFEPTFHRYRLDEPRHWVHEKPRNIFVCSMADLFGEWVPDEWIQEVFDACKQAPQHNYLFLTKNQKRYFELQSVGKLPHQDNMWYGATMTDTKHIKEVEWDIGRLIIGTKTFLSVEPVLEDIAKDKIFKRIIQEEYFDWVIVGVETGNRKDKVIPKREWIERIVNQCRQANIPVFMKSSLADIWGEELIQEFPKELVRRINI